VNLAVHFIRARNSLILQYDDAEEGPASSCKRCPPLVISRAPIQDARRDS